MAKPIEVDIPHKLGRAGVRARLDGGIDKLGEMFLGGAVVEKHWEGETLHFTVGAMGQRVASRLDLHDDRVHAVIDLPPFLALFADKIREKLASEGPRLLR